MGSPEDDISELAKAFLAEDHARIDARLPGWLEELTRVGANQCWHKRSTFKAHLYHVYQILKMWGQDDDVTSCGLFHSAYSNSYVNLAIFKAEADGRPRVKQMVGDSAEALIHRFCVVPRHQLIYDHLVKPLQDVYDKSKLVVPREGVTVPHIHTGEPVVVDRYEVAQILIMTIADFSEQWFSWQDTMFENKDGRMHYAGHKAAVLWPGPMKPGLFHSACSRFGLLARSCLDKGCSDEQPTILGRPAPRMPPVFNHCTELLLETDQQAALDAYWEAVTQCDVPERSADAQRLLEACARHNPYVAEPHTMLAQLHLNRGDFGAALPAARTALRLHLQWATAWDKRLSWDSWVAWTRVLLHAARNGAAGMTSAWPPPDTPFGMINLGLVPDMGY